METNYIRNQMTIKQTELNLTHQPDQRKKITNQLTILRYRLEIENIKEKIKKLQ